MMRALAVLLAALLLGSAAPAPVATDTGWRLVARFPHDAGAFTQGLLVADGILYESTGQYGHSEIRRVRLSDGRVLARKRIDARYFGEGLTNWGGDLLSITWMDGIGWRWNRATLKRGAPFHYQGEGWGLAQDGKRIILSDGTARLRFLDPVTLRENGAIIVRDKGQPIDQLNELEMVRGELLANVWMTNRIARINPRTGDVIGWIDLTALAREQRSNDPDAVLNGIAYDATSDRLYVTGKRWRTLYEITLSRD